MFVEMKETTVVPYNWVSVFDPFSFSFLLSSFFLPNFCLLVIFQCSQCWSRIVARREFAGFGWSFLPSCDCWLGSVVALDPSGPRSSLGAEITMTRHKA